MKKNRRHHVTSWLLAFVVAIVLFPATVFAASGPKITTQPKHEMWRVDNPANFTVEASGEDLSYQWQVKFAGQNEFKNALAPSAKTPYYYFTMQNGHKGMEVRCVITDKNGASVTSRTVTCNEWVTLSVGMYQEDLVWKNGEEASFTVEATGAEPTYQWQVKFTYDADFKNALDPSAKTPNFHFIMQPGHKGLQVRCVVTDKYDKVVEGPVRTIKESYTVTFNANGGEGAPDTVWKVKDETLVLPIETPTRDGFEFRGWATTTDPKTIYPAGAEYNENRGAKFYAIWDVSEFTIHYDANGGYGAPENQTKIKDEPLTLSLTKPYRKGYEFGGWITTTHPDEIYSEGDTYLHNYGANFYANWRPLERPEDETSGLNEITLSGNHGDHIITDRYCYVEGEKFFLMMEPDLDIPGDLANNIAMIIDALEEESGLSFMEWDEPSRFDNCTCLFGFNPWNNFDYGMKVPIFLFVDREGCGYIPSASDCRVDIFDYYLFSQEVWDSVPSFHDDPDRKGEYVDYYTFAHELTHALTLRHGRNTRIVAEGTADHYAGIVMNQLADRSEDFTESCEHMNFQFDLLEYALFNDYGSLITAENSENVFVNDFSDLSHAQRGAEYCFGRLLFDYVAEHYGKNFLSDFLAAVNAAGINNGYGNMTEEQMLQYTELFKSVVGDDIFTSFGTWYQQTYGELAE